MLKPVNLWNKIVHLFDLTTSYVFQSIDTNEVKEKWAA